MLCLMLNCYNRLLEEKIGYFLRVQGRIWVLIILKTFSQVPAKGSYQVDSGLGLLDILYKLSIFMTTVQQIMSSLVSGFFVHHCGRRYLHRVAFLDVVIGDVAKICFKHAIVCVFKPKVGAVEVNPKEICWRSGHYFIVQGATLEVNPTSIWV